MHAFLLNWRTVTAAYQWDDDPELMTMNPPMKGSLEELMDVTAAGDSFVITRRIEDTEEGERKKVQESYNLTEYAF